MKPLTHRALKRGEVKIGDWIPAADQATDAGRNDFLARQLARIKAAQAKPQTFVVVDIRKRP